MELFYLSIDELISSFYCTPRVYSGWQTNGTPTSSYIDQVATERILYFMDSYHRL